MLFAAFPAARGDVESWQRTLRVYAEMLLDLDRDAVRKAVQRLIGTAKWLPTVAEIRAAATELVQGPMRSGAEAYDELTRAVRRHGRCYGGEPAPEFADPLISRCLGVWGSWNDLCNSPSDDPGGRARFIELYGELAKRERDAVSSGIPLPEPRSETALAAPRKRREPLPAPVAAPATPTELAGALVRTPRPRPPDVPYRRYSAEELDAALRGAL